MKLINSDCIAAMKAMGDNSVDSIVTDPPYELGFMGKSWDASGIAFNIEVWQEALRVLKPGGHLIAFSGSRTYHRMAVAIEDAGFEIRDQIQWIYGSGFPKSHNISKGIDKQAGLLKDEAGDFRIDKDGTAGYSPKNAGDYIPPKPQSAAAQQWQGWGTALKPAHEPIVLARKPLIGTVAANVLTHGVGGLNIDGSRVQTDDKWEATGKQSAPSQTLQGGVDGSLNISVSTTHAQGRWPANVIHDGSDEVVALFPDTGKSTGGRIGKKTMGDVTNVPAGEYEAGDPGYGDNGSAARFFYCAKASKKDRNEGLDGFVSKFTAAAEFRPNHMEKALEGESGNPYGRFQPVANHHPTVKPTDLMRYLCRLVTPPAGIVLDPFMGSGSTGKAAILEGFDFIGIDQSAEYVAIAKARIEFAKDNA